MVRPATCVVDRLAALNASSEVVDNALSCVVVKPCVCVEVNAAICAVEKLSNVAVARPPICVAVRRARACVVVKPLHFGRGQIVDLARGQRSDLRCRQRSRPASTSESPIVVVVRPATCAVDSFAAFNASSEVVDSVFSCVVVRPCVWVGVKAASWAAEKLSKVAVARPPICVAVSAPELRGAEALYLGRGQIVDLHSASAMRLRTSSRHRPASSSDW